MAGIDKIYGSKAEAVCLENWLRRHRPKWDRYLYGANAFDHLGDDEERPLSNFSCTADKWMARYCPLPFVLERLCQQYSGSKTAMIAARRLAAIRERSK